MHEHRYWTSSRQKSDTCIICGFNPNSDDPSLRLNLKTKAITMQNNFLQIGETFHCLRCHKEIPHDDFTEHVDKTCPKIDQEASLTGCKYEGKIKL